MIQISGSANRSFLFPARLAETFAYYEDIPRSLSFLPHISIVSCQAADQYRLLYSALESGIYRVNIFCDVRTTADQNKHSLRISPSNGMTPVKNKASLHSMTCQGSYMSEILFSEMKEQTRIAFRMELKASFPAPFALRFVPGALVNIRANRILQHRMEEITNRFIEQSIQEYTR